MSDPDDDWFTIKRPYPYVICNAKSPEKCLRRPDGWCPVCWVEHVHGPRPADSDPAPTS